MDSGGFFHVEEMRVLIVLIAAWAAWFIYWWCAARGANPARFAQAGPSLPYMGPLLACDLLLAIPMPFGVPALPLAGLGLVAVGLAATVWARRHLGASWAGRLSIQHDHRLVRSGPYARVRHPIYTGLLIAFAGTALLRGGIALLALLFAYRAFRFKLRVEERQLTGIFPAYADYVRTTPALFPRWLNRG